MELLLSNMTTMHRAILDDPKTSESTKLECLKWSNELAHRIWNLLFELKRGEDEDSATRLAQNIDFYRKQEKELAGHLGATINSTINRYNYLQNRIS